MKLRETRRMLPFTLALLASATIIMLYLLCINDALVYSSDTHSATQYQRKLLINKRNAICAPFDSEKDRPLIANISFHPSYNLYQYPASVPRVHRDPARHGPNPTPHLRIITINSKPEIRPIMCHTTLFSAALNDIPLEVYGATPYFRDKTRGRGGKLDRLLPLLCAIDPTDAVLMVDAFDVIFQRGHADIAHTYFARWNSPRFVMSTELNCYPEDVEAVCGKSAQIPEAPLGGFPYANSGVLVGNVAAFVQVLDASLKVYEAGYKGGDQGAMAQVLYGNYAQGTSDEILLDHMSELSSSGHPPIPDFAFYQFQNKTYAVNPATMTVPSIVHLNGDSSKRKHYNGAKFRKLMYYLNGYGKIKPEYREKIENYVVHVDGIPSRVGDLCLTHI
ncbi:hypothetical protein BC830DRAFT_1079434 [Chytriomyces sp. MP71]|nr:hypothetical protein BC830DRAFT_1079434 [Chytriomyces sp. MP71]